jgi:hypothetical protein
MTATGDSEIQLQERDYDILRGLFEARVMTARHVEALYFPDKKPYAKKRLQKLKLAGLVGERRRWMNQASVLFLTRKGYMALASDGHLLGYPELSMQAFTVRAKVSELTLEHELAVMDVKAAFHSAFSQAKELSLVEFSTWPSMYQFRARRPGTSYEVSVKPDAYVRFHEKEDGGLDFIHDCFLEVDRSSEKQDVLVIRACCYSDYLYSGGFAVTKGAGATDFKQFPFRVLIVLRSQERRNNTAERLLLSTPRIRHLAWLTTFGEVTSDPLGPIWVRPVDYLDATRDTPFDLEQRNPSVEYRRQVEREKLVESRVAKQRLRDGPSAGASAAPTSENPGTNQ